MMGTCPGAVRLPDGRVGFIMCDTTSYIWLEEILTDAIPRRHQDTYARSEACLAAGHKRVPCVAAPVSSEYEKHSHEFTANVCTECMLMDLACVYEVESRAGDVTWVRDAFAALRARMNNKPKDGDA